MTKRRYERPEPSQECQQIQPLRVQGKQTRIRLGRFSYPVLESTLKE